MTNIAPTLAPSHLSDPVADEDDLLARFAPVLERIAAGNAERKRHRKFPFEEVDELNRAGFGRIRIPVELGGFGASLEQAFVLLARLGAADANVAHVWRNHLAFVEDRLNAAPSEGNARWIARFLDGEFVGGGWTEANNGTFANIATTVRRVGDAYRVTGAKYYATGSLYADWLDVIGKDDDGSLYTALVRRDDPGVELVDDWTGFGQQTTASGSATYTDVPADPDDVFPASERFVYQGHFYQTAILAVLSGITQAALRDGITALRERGRNYPQGLDPVPARDAQVLQVIGEVSAQVFAAESALRTVARSLDAVAAAQAAGDLTALIVSLKATCSSLTCNCQRAGRFTFGQLQAIGSRWCVQFCHTTLQARPGATGAPYWKPLWLAQRELAPRSVGVIELVSEMVDNEALIG